MAGLILRDLTKAYDGTQVLHGIDLEIEDGEFVVFVGPSGCGKSTTLRLIAGLEEVTAGEIEIGDRVVNHLEPKDRDIAMVFQNYAIYPHMTVRKNIGFGLLCGFTDVALFQPMNYWKNAVQQSLPFTLNPSLLYRGVAANLANNSFCVGAQFWLNGVWRKMITGGVNRDLSNIEKVGGGVFAGWKPFAMGAGGWSASSSNRAAGGPCTAVAASVESVTGASLRRSAWCPFSPFSWDFIERVVT